jgi:hypothetical protein
MSTTVETRVEYDDRFRQRPELVRAAEGAMAYLDGRLPDNPLVPPPSVIRWGLRPLDPSSVELTMADEADGLRAARVFPARHLADPVVRDLWALSVWDDLLTERSRANMAQLRRMIAAFSADEGWATEEACVTTVPEPQEARDGR